MAAIEINQTFETAVKTMLNKHATDAVKALSEKYNFPLEEALAHLDLKSARVSKKEKADKSETVEKAPKAKSSPKGKGKATLRPTNESGRGRGITYLRVVDSLKDSEKLKSTQLRERSKMLHAATDRISAGAAATPERASVGATT